MILTVEELKDLLKFGTAAAATGTDPLLKTAKVGIYVNNIAPTPNTVMADLTEASWTGYARSGTVTWGTPILSNETNLPAVVGDVKSFTVTANPDPQTMQGYFLAATISSVDHLLAIAPIANPITPAAGTQIDVQPRVGLDDEAVNPSGDVTFI